MFSKKKPRPSKPANSSTSNKLPVPKHSVPSVISEDMNILGNLISDGYIDINGHIEGNVKCFSLTVREKGMIKGDVIAENITIEGQICGLIKAKHVQLNYSARVRGVIMHESISISDGAFIDGQCKRTDRQSNGMERRLTLHAENDDGDEGDVIESFHLVEEKVERI